MGKRNGTTKLEHGSVYKKNGNGTYYFRYQINGRRKAVSLQTKKHEEAVKKANEIIPILKAGTVDIISEHVKHAKGMAGIVKKLPLKNAWEVYSKSPERATPATVSEQNAYLGTYNEFLEAIGNTCVNIDEVVPETAEMYSQFLKASELAVDTHNRKIRRMRKIFDVLKEYRSSDNPFTSKTLFRKEREEQGNTVRRLSFTKEEEERLLEVLEDDHYRVMNKKEIRVIYHIGMFTGQRFKDCILLQWDMVDLKRRRIWVKQFKTGKEVTIPIAPRLLKVLEEAVEWKENNYVCPKVADRYNMENSSGKNTGNNLVNIDALRVIKWIGLEPSVKVKGRKKSVTVYGFHSLRHSFVSHCAEAGVPKAVVLSIIGTNSEIVDKHYTHIGDEAQEQAINQLFGDDTVSDRERIERALGIIEKLKKKTKTINEIEKALR